MTKPNNDIMSQVPRDGRRVKTKHTDILIVGGGLTGAALMLALQNQGYEVLLLDAYDFSQQATFHFDARTLALAPASVKILRELHVWPLLAEQATPIEKIHVSQQGHFGVTRLQGELDEPLGHVLELQYIGQALHQLLPPDRILAPAKLVALDQTNAIATIQQGKEKYKIKAQLIVAADGGHSTVRQLAQLPAQVKTYAQHALIANIGLKRGHANCAYERFTPQGPLALLPMTHHRAALVWTMPVDEAKHLQAVSDESFLKQLQQAFGYRLGRLVKVGARSLFPLQEIIMPTPTAWPLVFIGNAAHTLHPVAGQGFNLGLRDVAALAQCIIREGLGASMLAQYQSMRQADQAAIIRFTDGLIQLFGSQFPGLALGRGLGLMALDNSPFLKTMLARYARGYAGVVSDLVCGIPLK